MTPPQEYDFAIVGAGVSGLSLALQLLEGELADRSLLLVEGDGDPDALRTLSFWSEEAIALEPLVRHRWSSIELVDRDARVEVALPGAGYRTLFLADLRRAAAARLDADPRHRRVAAPLDSLCERDDHVELEVAGERLRARWVFDSRSVAATARLTQHVHGWIVRTEDDAFEPRRATLLDFRVPGPRGAVFAYRLPFGRREALVELVAFEPIDAEATLAIYLTEVLGLRGWRSVAEEAGTIGLSTAAPIEPAGARVRRIGVAAGCVKPSTGYALTRIVAHNAELVAALRRAIAPPPVRRPHRGFLALDGILLELWARWPARIPRVFLRLFARNPAARVLAFLDERAGAWAVLRVGLSLPWATMARAAIAWLLRRGRP